MSSRATASKAQARQDSFRVSQRRPQACVECSKKKVKCDKRIPCARCTKSGLRCYREKIQVSKALSRDRDELEFLKNLRSRLESVNCDKSAIRVVIHRISFLEYGENDPQGTSSPEPQESTHDRGLGETVFDTREARHSDSISQGHFSPYLVPDQALGNTSPAATQFPFLNPPNQSISEPRTSSWAKHYSACYPHRSCRCKAQRDVSEIISINSDLSNTLWVIGDLSDILPLLPSVSDSRKLINFHIEYILWHHNAIYAPTFLQQCEKFWELGCYDHPLWVALYLSALCTSIWCAQNSTGAQLALGLVFDEQEAPRLYKAMVDVLYKERFMENLSLYSLQAIIVSTRASNNLGYANLTAILLSAAIRIAHYMGLHKITDRVSPGLNRLEQWYETVERETGKRVWYQLVNQDYLSTHYTDTYVVVPGQYSTQLPLNCDNHDLLERPHEAPTISSYTIMMSKIATLFPRLLDNIGPMQEKALDAKFQCVLQAESDLRQLIREIPSYLLHETPPGEHMPTWISVARRTIAMSAADKIIMIHRPFLFLSFRSEKYLHTRRTCVAAATTILRYHENNTNLDNVSVWTHSAFCITAANVLGLELYHMDAEDERVDTYRNILIRARIRLLQRRGDVLSQRSASLIDTILRFEKQRAQSRQMQNAANLLDFQTHQFSYDALDFNQTMANFIAMDQWVALEGIDLSSTLELEPVSSLEIDDFEPWFSQAFGTI